MEIITNHNVNLGSPGGFFLEGLALQYPSLLYIPHGGFSTSFNAALISPLLTPWGIHLNNKNTPTGFTMRHGGIRESVCYIINK